MIVMGIDTGLRNLGICILNPENIYLWDNYSLLDEQIQCSHEGCSCKAKWKPGMLCGRHYKGDKATKHAIKQKKCASYSPFEIAGKVDTLLDEILKNPVCLELDTIILELQPKINARAKMISHFIYFKVSQFITTNGLKATVKFERASYKLKHFKGPRGEKVKNTYANRKKRSIEYTKQVLSDSYDEQWSDFFNSLKKADDAADSFLLCWNKCV